MADQVVAGESDALREVNAAFYHAVEELDLEAMDRVWLHESWVRCIHPGWDLLVGWEVVRQSWQQIFSGTSWIRVIPTSVDVRVLGDVGVAVAQATNLFLRTDQGWLLIHHHSSPAPVSVTQPFSGTVQ